MSYQEAQETVRRRAKIADTPAELVAQWEYLISQAEEGYSWDFSEYLNEIRARDALELLLSAPELCTYTEHKDLVETVAALDERFRKLFRRDVELSEESHWWRRGVLRRAGAPYAEYMRDAYGFEVELQE
jgi:hypothetical protein